MDEETIQSRGHEELRMEKIMIGLHSVVLDIYLAE